MQMAANDTSRSHNWSRFRLGLLNPHTREMLRLFTSPVTSHLFPTSGAKSSCLTPYGTEVAHGPLDKKDKRVIYRNAVLSLPRPLTLFPLNELSHTRPLHLLCETTAAKNKRKKHNNTTKIKQCTRDSFQLQKCHSRSTVISNTPN